jgi:uncharacterized membrane protein
MKEVNMLLDSSQSIPGKAQPTVGQLVPTLAFDWLYSALAFLVSAGFFMDGWSHGTFGPDQSVFSDYHFLLFGSFGVLGLFLFAQAFLNRRQGYTGLRSIPAGYGISALGVILFGVTGFFDQAGHALFGFEADIEAFFSPTHMGLFAGWGMVLIGPTLAAWQRQQQQGKPMSLGQFLPALFAWVGVVNVITFVWGENFYATGTQWMFFETRTNLDLYGQMLGIMSMIVETVVLVGSFLWLMGKFQLPVGSFTLFFLMFSLHTLLAGSPSLIGIFLITGSMLDVVYKLLKPDAFRPLQLYLMCAGIPLIFWGCFYAFALTTNYRGGIWYSPYLWTGSIVQCVVTGLLLAGVTTPQLSINKSTTMTGLEHD